jgi:hypothetical protein
MSEVELETAEQSETSEADAAVLTTHEALPAATDQGSRATPPPEESPVTEASSPDSPIKKAGKRAISPRKLAANQANARHSTGPKTMEGKAKSAQNAIKHGIFAKRFLHGASAEDVAEMETAIQEMRDYYQPVGKLEEMLVEKIVVESARYARILGFEEQELSRKHAFFGVGLDRFGRYSTSTNRALSRAMEDLARVQAARRAREVPRQ